MSTLVVALAGGAFLARIGLQSTLVRVVAVVAAIAWTIAVISYLVAVSYSIKEFGGDDDNSEDLGDEEESDAPGVDDRLEDLDSDLEGAEDALTAEARTIVENLFSERAALRKRLWIANALAGVAVVLSIATVVLSLLDQSASRKPSVALLNVQGQTVVSQFCDLDAGKLRGSIDPGTLASNFVVLHDPVGCRGANPVYLDRTWLVFLAGNA